MDRGCPVPIKASQIKVWSYGTDLIANPTSEQGGFGVIEDDALFFIEPAFAFINGGDDSVQANRKNPVSQYAAFRIARFSLPGKQVDKFRYLQTDFSTSSDDGGASRGAVGNFSSRTAVTNLN